MATLELGRGRRGFRGGLGVHSEQAGLDLGLVGLRLRLHLRLHLRLPLHLLLPPPLLLVHLHVLHHVVPLDEPAIAVRALVRLLPVVDLAVAVQ